MEVNLFLLLKLVEDFKRNTLKDYLSKYLIENCKKDIKRIRNYEIRKELKIICLTRIP